MCLCVCIAIQHKWETSFGCANEVFTLIKRVRVPSRHCHYIIAIQPHACIVVPKDHRAGALLAKGACHLGKFSQNNDSVLITMVEPVLFQEQNI